MPFLVMCYEYHNQKYWYECDFPIEFIKYWEDKNFKEHDIKYIIVCGQWLPGLKDFDDVIRALQG